MYLSSPFKAGKRLTKILLREDNTTPELELGNLYIAPPYMHAKELNQNLLSRMEKRRQRERSNLKKQKTPIKETKEKQKTTEKREKTNQQTTDSSLFVVRSLCQFMRGQRVQTILPPSTRKQPHIQSAIGCNKDTRSGRHAYIARFYRYSELVFRDKVDSKTLRRAQMDSCQTFNGYRLQ